jgi:hypothetical protein
LLRSLGLVAQSGFSVSTSEIEVAPVAVDATIYPPCLASFFLSKIFIFISLSGSGKFSLFENYFRINLTCLFLFLDFRYINVSYLFFRIWTLTINP